MTSIHIILAAISITYFSTCGYSQDTTSSCTKRLAFCERWHGTLQLMLDKSLVKLARLQERSVELENENNIKQSQLDVLIHQINNPGKRAPTMEPKLARASPLPLAKLRDLLTRVDATCVEKFTQCQMVTTHGEFQYKEEQYRLNRTSMAVIQNEEKNKKIRLQIYQLSEKLKATRGL